MKRRVFLKDLVLSGAAAVMGSRSPLSGAESLREYALLPDFPIIDAHHHLYERSQPLTDGQPQRYLLHEFLADVKNSGHNIIASVYAQDTTMYRADGPQEFRSLGETEFANGQAAMSASGIYGPSRMCAGIVGEADLRLGDRVRQVLEAHLQAAHDRFRGIRMVTAWDAYPVFGRPMNAALKGLHANTTFRKGAAALATLNLSYDVHVFHPQITEIADLARALPNLKIILNHSGSPIAIGPYRDRADTFKTWKAGIYALAKHENAFIKLGGLGLQFSSPEFFQRTPSAASVELAAAWRPYFEVCVEAFGVGRCMFQSNFPADNGVGDYGTLWNAFKRVTEKFSEGERTALFGGTAKDVYRLHI